MYKMEVLPETMINDVPSLEKYTIWICEIMLSGITECLFKCENVNSHKYLINV